jgi:hypothetical protein
MHLKPCHSARCSAGHKSLQQCSWWSLLPTRLARGPLTDVALHDTSKPRGGPATAEWASHCRVYSMIWSPGAARAVWMPGPPPSPHPPTNVAVFSGSESSSRLSISTVTSARYSQSASSFNALLLSPGPEANLVRSWHRGQSPSYRRDGLRPRNTSRLQAI